MAAKSVILSELNVFLEKEAGGRGGWRVSSEAASALTGVLSEKPN